MKASAWRRRLERTKKGWSGEYLVGTVHFHGPDGRRAARVVGAG